MAQDTYNVCFMCSACDFGNRICHSRSFIAIESTESFTTFLHVKSYHAVAGLILPQNLSLF